MNTKTKFTHILSVILLFFSVSGCERKPHVAVDRQCLDCHQLALDQPHDLGCTTCHNGKNKAKTAEEAHAGLVADPAHPATMRSTCGRCHAQIVNSAANSLHFTLRNEVNSVRKAFGAKKELNTLLEIPVTDSPANMLELADDLLRRRCLRCHVYYQGDSYSETLHGAGCAACHLKYQGGSLASHTFVKSPDDNQCLHCHYGNFVGADYYGRFEHDFKWEYRTPYTTDGGYPPRPYGVEFHQLEPDIHRLNGMSCIDCHSGRQLMGIAPAEKTTCQTCHLRQPGDKELPDNLIVENDTLYLIAKLDGRRHKVPLLKNPVHQTLGKKAACVVCHAQWSYNDKGTNLMRQDTEDYGPWTYLSVQGSSEVEKLLESSFSKDVDLPPSMTDKITGKSSPGIWYKGYELRRWTPPLIGKGADGILKIYRPILDLRLSYVNQDEEVAFDGIKADDRLNGLRPYTPHTIGKAGIFYQRRLQENIKSDYLQKPEKP